MAEEKDITSLENTMTEQPASGPLGNLSKVLRSALGEATQTQVKSRIEAAGGFLEGGAAPNVIRAAIGLAQSGLKDTRESIYSDTINVYTKEQEMASARRKESLDLLKTFSDNGTLGDMPDDALLEIGKSAGIGEGQALAWKARINKATKISDQAAVLELDKIRSEIAENKAQTSKAQAEASKLNRKPMDGFISIDIQDDFSSDAANYKSRVNKGEITEGQALQELATLYPDRSDVSEEAFLKVWGVQSIGAEDIQESPETIPGSFEQGGGILEKLGFTEQKPTPSGNIYGTGNFSKTTLDERIKTLTPIYQKAGSGWLTGWKSMLEEELVKEGYDKGEIAKRTRK